jgi:hypothetical protein
VFENRLLRGKFGPKTVEVTGCCEKVADGSGNNKGKAAPVFD